MTKGDKLPLEGHVAMKKLLKFWTGRTARRRKGGRAILNQRGWMRDQLERMIRMEQGIISGSVGR
ncbi:MAG: hypothetical protein UX91_C0007G0146 [Candidatus Amesbacteria bacterium GW2011_GWB1_47_19]|nr:MAG: hypothetical protein UW51_C0006G0045 [Candidatus Amesbacteria bacterium GW2011_GWA1_44_24]KKU31923.1 MAG: hypothetical protein UX46_C0002G0146 [Candidatus Amesbacteria bacterium GW2011_GWC1_46_24]KKU66859.1 MAG: hypothetical protein UX91_C0007G0146 [Candidatus Amesbacteria bacterium GW2011_GWB1_47_19]